MKLSLADYLSLSRIPLAILFFFFLQDIFISILILILVVVTDVLDGFLARKLNQVTTYGGALDPLADKFFIVGAFFAFMVSGLFSGVYFLLLILRDLYSVSEMISIKITKHEKKHKASPWGKITTTLQFFAIGIFIFKLEMLYLPILILIVISSIFTIYGYAKSRWFE